MKTLLCLTFCSSLAVYGTAFAQTGEDVPWKNPPKEKREQPRERGQNPDGPQIIEPQAPDGLPPLSKESRDALTAKLRKAIKEKDLLKQAELEYQLGRLINEKHAGEDYERGVSYLKSAARHYGELKKPFQRAYCLTHLGFLYRKGGETALAIAVFEKALAEYRAMGDRGRTAWVSVRLGNACVDDGKHVAAMEHFDRSVRIYEQLGNRSSAASVLSNIGNMHSVRGKYKQALACYGRSLKAFQQLKDLNGVASTLSNMGRAHYSMNAHEKALDHYGRSLKIFEELRNRSGAARALNNLGNVHAARGEYDLAMEFNEESLRILEQLGDRRGTAKTLNNIGLLHSSRGAYDKALAYCGRSLKIYEQLGDRNGTAFALGYMGKVHRKRNEHTRAIAVLTRAVNAFRGLRVPHLVYSYGSLLADSREKSGDAKGALTTWESLVKDLPGRARPMSGLALFLLTTRDKALRDPKRALSLAKKALASTNERSAAMLNTLAEAHHASNMFREAVKYAKESEKLAPGKFTESLKRFRKALELGKQIERPER